MNPEHRHAWLLRITERQQVAVREIEMKEYVIWPELTQVPLAPPCCQSMMVWHGTALPVVDFQRLLGYKTGLASHHLGVVAYQTTPLQPLSYLGLLLGHEPERITVSNRQQCEMPGDWPVGLLALAKSCFSHNDIATPILDINRLGSLQLWQAHNIATGVKHAAL